ncbi:DEAD/DEAH box helicase [Acinetobacter larvae]|uniref:DNA2/NAM7 helicase-like C-terminal domain-containing protein n=1 Tax=Acinetobacter larvae TaxID=1789224 RepID=A0A1B2LZL2_9GAMM|nr:DEAD/DEAH box helicase [Acinetobacter larvae]AOA58392.1 hypothetical protein BFG52_08525 [Acinetobacter larvae]
MRINFKETLNNLLNRKKSFKKNTLDNDSQAQENTDLSTIENKIRCEKILNYWLDVELFDLPECPFKNNKDILSEEAESFTAKIATDLVVKIKNNSDYIHDESRLVIMFQCHKAGYIAENIDLHPNFIIPKTYLVAHSFVPHYDPKVGTIQWSLSTEDKDLIINLSTIRTIYRKCPPSTAHNLSLSEWIAARVDEIENLFKINFSDPEQKDLFTTEILQDKIKKINRTLSNKFWPEKTARDFMMLHCQALESEYAHDVLDQPAITTQGDLTFRWRFSFYPEGNESQQLGPFFVKDLEHCINQLDQKGLSGLSMPLQKYLCGTQQRTYIPEAVGHGHFYVPLTHRIALGRWPTNAKYGLSLLQTLAVNVAKETIQNPVVAVNGPPGTGKTTLLKDIIAERFVLRTVQLLKFYTKNNEAALLDNTELLDQVMNYSILVASSNNKAVENISKELPSLNSIAEEFKADLKHFSHIAAQDEWGLFCAVLGNANNRKNFKKTLAELSAYFRFINDRYRLNLFTKQISNTDDISQKLIYLKKQIEFWKQNQLIFDLFADFEQCSNFKTHLDFFKPLREALYKVAQDKLQIAEFLEFAQAMQAPEWDKLTFAFIDVKKQWFAKKLYIKHQENKLNAAISDFQQTFKELNQCLGAAEQFIVSTENLDMWQLDAQEHLSNASAYKLSGSIDPSEFESILQKSTPFSSEKINQCRSQLFIHALALNEAILETQSAELKKYWSDLEALLDGHLESNEQPVYHQRLWSMLFLFFPVLSTSLSSVENQFKLMQQVEGFGLALLDEAGQAVNYQVVGLLQRCKQVVFVGDPIQLEPVINIPYQIDRSIAEDYMLLAHQYAKQEWGDLYLVSTQSAQTIADRASQYYAKIGEREVGIPLLVHRRCLEPMFSIANRIAYDNKMVAATSIQHMQDVHFIPSGWIHVEERAENLNAKGYANRAEASVALKVIQYLAENQAAMLAGGVFIITPFTQMKNEIIKEWRKQAKDPNNHAWMNCALGEKAQHKNYDHFWRENIGTVHSFQGKEASTVIVCTAASVLRRKTGGIKWVNSKPNLLNVAVTRAKSHLFVIGHLRDWSTGKLSIELQDDMMYCYQSFQAFVEQPTIDYQQLKAKPHMMNHNESTTFYFGG